MNRRAFVIATGAGIMALPFIPHFGAEPAFQAAPAHARSSGEGGRSQTLPC